MRAGEVLFERIGCAACHVPALKGREGPVELYSDLLLHDVLPADQATAPTRLPPVDEATSHPLNTNPRPFRTAPLWGVSRTAPYLHDGSADTFDDATHAHDNEAALVRTTYLALTEDNRAALLAFLASL